MTLKRAVCLNCIDGAVQLPTIEWIKNHYPVDHVDMITEPGMDGLLADNNQSIEEIKRKLGISIEKNQASMIFVAGHHGCKGNPVSDTEHKDHIQSAVDRLQKEFVQISVAGLWVNKKWETEALQK